MGPQSAPITASANGDNKIITGVPNRRIRVIAFVLSFSGNVNAQFREGTGGTSSADLSGLYYGAAAKDSLSPAIPASYLSGPPGQFTTATVGNDVYLKLSAGTAVGGHVVYEVVI